MPSTASRSIEGCCRSGISGCACHWKWTATEIISVSSRRRATLTSMDVAPSYAQARRSIDAAPSADPNQTADGQPAELVYADRMEQWVGRVRGINRAARLGVRSGDIH